MNANKPSKRLVGGPWVEYYQHSEEISRRYGLPESRWFVGDTSARMVTTNAAHRTIADGTGGSRERDGD